MNRISKMVADNSSMSDQMIRHMELCFRFILVVFAVIGLIWQDFLITYQGTLLYHALMTLLIALIPDLISRLTKYTLTAELRAAFLLFVFLAQFLGEVFDFFNRFFWWDKMLHFASAFLITLIGYAVFFINMKKVCPKKNKDWLAFSSIFSISLSLALAAIWEVFEYLMDTLLGMNMQKSGLVDTMEDLIFCLFGTVVASCIYLYSKKKNQCHILVLAVDRLADAN